MIEAPPGFRGGFHTDTEHRVLASEGAGPFRVIPAAVARPLDRDDVALLAAWATETGTPLTPRGAGSGMPGGNIGPGVVVDLGSLDRPARVGLGRVAAVGTAVTWQTLTDAAGHFGFRLPPDPSSGRFCTLGGMVATNASGARSLKYGSIRRWVRGVELATADGEVVWLHRAASPPARPPAQRLHGPRARVLDRFASIAPGLRALGATVAERYPRTSKNSAGYALDHWLASGDLVDLVIGSEGTLGIVTRIELQLDLLPDAAATVVLVLESLDAMADVVGACKALDAVAIELLPAPEGQAARLLVEFEGASGLVRDLATQTERVAGVAAATRATDDTEREALWRERRGTSAALARLGGQARSLQVAEDGCVPVARLAEYLRGVHAAAADVDIPIVTFGHAGDGHLHVNALADLDAPGIDDRLLSLRDAVHALAIALGGTTSGEHGDGRLRADALEALYGSAIVDAFRRVKAAFDPADVLNPGVILAAGALPPFKGGPGAPPVPPELADRLRTRERDAAWDMEDRA